MSFILEKDTGLAASQGTQPCSLDQPEHPALMHLSYVDDVSDHHWVNLSVSVVESVLPSVLGRRVELEHKFRREGSHYDVGFMLDLREL